MTTTRELARQFHKLLNDSPLNEQYDLLCNLVEEILGETDENCVWQATSEMNVIDYLVEQNAHRCKWGDGIPVGGDGEPMYCRPRDENRAY